jgi:hypothetical protein
MRWDIIIGRTDLNISLLALLIAVTTSIMGMGTSQEGVSAR